MDRNTFVGFYEGPNLPQLKRAIRTFNAMCMCAGSPSGLGIAFGGFLDAKLEQEQAYAELAAHFSKELAICGYDEMKWDRLICDITASGKLGLWVTPIEDGRSPFGRLGQGRS